MSNLYERFFKNSCNNTRKQVIRKIKDSNTLKSNLTNPHYRTIILNDVARLPFSFEFGKNFIPSERYGVGNDTVSPIFEITSIERLLQIIPASVVLKVQSSGDTTLITPWVKIANDMSIKISPQQRATFEAGKLGIPIRENELNVLVFFVCGGLDDNDLVPDWVVELGPKDLLVPVTPETYQECQGVGQINLDKKNKDWTSITKDQDISSGDFLRVRSAYYEVWGIGRDEFNPNFDCVRFRTDFSKNAKNASYGIVKNPIFHGNIAWIPKVALTKYNPITMQMTKTYCDGFGQLNIRFQNACFNKLGFLVHDTAV